MGIYTLSIGLLILSLVQKCAPQTNDICSLSNPDIPCTSNYYDCGPSSKPEQFYPYCDNDLNSFITSPCTIESMPLISKYNCDATVIECVKTDMSIKQIPEDLGQCTAYENSNRSYLMLNGKNFQTIQDNIFPGAELNRLVLNNNRIEVVDEAAFDSIIGLIALQLSRNLITNISFGTGEKWIRVVALNGNKLTKIRQYDFSSLGELRILELRTNNIEYIHPNAFDSNEKLVRLNLLFNNLKTIEFKIASLIYLNIYNNKFTTIKNNTFQGFSSLQQLVMHSNYIHNMSTESMTPLADSLRYLEMSNNYFNSTESQAFGKNFTYLKYLRLSENSFESLERESFLFLPNLEVLDLSSNKIDTIEPGSFVGLDSLRVLVLVNLNLETVNDKQTFYGLVKLEQLNMSKNRISNLSDKVFSSLESLKLLKLEANKLEVLSRHVFDGLLNLVELSLVQNLFEKLENYSFSVLTRVSTLRLNYNIIKDIESNAFYGINNSLASLDISFNKLQFVRKSHFNSLTKLVELVLVNNQISSIEAGSFANLINLEILDLEDNSLFRIESLLFVSLIKLRVLILTKNVIQELKQDSFQYMQNLNELILKENVITTLNSGIFKRLLRLKILDLSDNLINEIDFMCFDGLDNLEQLYMDNVKQYVNIKPARGFKLLPVLTTLQLTNATIQLIRQFDMANLTIINFELAELDMATIQKLPTNKLEQISLKNIRFNGKVDSALMPFGESLITIDLSGNVLSNNFQSLLLNRSINVEGLGLSNCNGLNNLSIDYFFNLTDLDLSWGMIRSIDSFLNQNLYLQTLDLSHNFLTQIGVDDFHGLESLNYLNLSFNMIDKVEEFSFRDLISIITLDMSNNRIKFLDQNSLGHNHFDNIKLLVLSNNSQLNTIGFNVYSSSLTVDLVNCGFDHVPSQKFINDPVIEFFNLSNNRISRVNKTDFQNSKSIVQLKLSGNAINSVDFDSFHSLNQLNILDLSRNNLTELHNETFKGLLYLEYLNISFNQIAVINTKLFFELAKLKSLDLSHNLIKTIDQFVFLTNHELKFLFLHHNPLTDFFANETLEGLDSIKFIYIGSPVKISMNSCEIIKLMLSAFEVEKKGAIAYYDAVDILTRTDGEGTDDRLKSYTPVQCVQIVYLVRFDVKLNLNDENDVNLFLSECTKMLSRLYYMIGAGVYVSFLDAVQNLN